MEKKNWDSDLNQHTYIQQIAFRDLTLYGYKILFTACSAHRFSVQIGIDHSTVLSDKASIVKRVNAGVHERQQTKTLIQRIYIVNILNRQRHFDAFLPVSKIQGNERRKKLGHTYFDFAKPTNLIREHRHKTHQRKLYLSDPNIVILI